MTREELLAAALQKIVEGAPEIEPDRGDYDFSNSGDVTDYGIALEHFAQAKIAREALNAPSQCAPCKGCPHPDFCREQNGCQVEECLAPAQGSPDAAQMWREAAEAKDKRINELEAMLERATLTSTSSQAIEKTGGGAS